LEDLDNIGKIKITSEMEQAMMAYLEVVVVVV